MKADLHVHTWASNRSGSMKFLRSRDCYSAPKDVYRTAKLRGMDLVTFTDHDSIGGCLEFLAAHPDCDDFLIGEEVSCRFTPAAGTALRDVEVHLGVYGMTEAAHRAIQPLRRDVFEAIRYLNDAGLFFALNHLLHFYRADVPLDAYLQLLQHVSALEVRNGAMLAAHNEWLEWIVRASGRGLTRVGGSDAHTLRRVGTTWTEVPRAGNVDEYLAGLRSGTCRPGGAHGGVMAIAGDVYGVVARYIASLSGFGPTDHGLIRRAACLTFSAGSLPFQFIPLIVALRTKRRERTTVAGVQRTLQRLRGSKFSSPLSPSVATLEPWEP